MSPIDNFEKKLLPLLSSTLLAVNLHYQFRHGFRMHEVFLCSQCCLSGSAWVRSGRLKGRIGFRNKSLIHNIVQYIHYIDCTVRDIYGAVFTYVKILEWNVNKSASRLYVYAPKVE
jgi:hypothetical protein